MDLAAYIQKSGDENVANLIGVKKRTISSWRRLERAPTPLQSLIIIEKTKGKVDWQGIYLPYAKNKKKLNIEKMVEKK